MGRGAGTEIKRRVELDALRGLAAISVLLYHVLATNSAQLTDALSLQPVDSVAFEALAYSPLHVAWLGAEAVWLFFVLSGFVLTRAASRPSFSLSAYYPSRIVRLYLPVAAAVGVAWVTYLFPHVLTADMDQLLPTSYPFAAVLKDLTLLGGTSTSLGVLWSLQWEVLFSLALPLFLIVGRRLPVWSLGVIAGLVAFGWYWNDQVLSYLPMFLIGVVLASRWDQVEKAFGFVGRGGVLGNALGLIMLLISICGLCAFYLVGPFFFSDARVWTLPIVLGSITLIMVLCQVWQPLRAVLGTRPLAYLGRISYSLYLVHLPIVVLMNFVFGPGAASAFAGVVASLLLAAVFYRFVEAPAHRLSQRIGASIRAQEQDRDAGTPHPPAPMIDTVRKSTTRQATWVRGRPRRPIG